MGKRRGSRLGILLALLSGLVVAAAAEAQDELFVANGNSITVFSRTASGNTAPLRTLTGPALGLAPPGGIAVTVAAVTASTPIPTLSEWAQLGLALILVGVAVWYLRRRRTLGTA